VAAIRKIRYATVQSAGYVLDRKNPLIREAIGESPLLAVVDQEVDGFYGTDLRAYLDAETNLLGYTVIEGSESAKSWPAVQRICDEAADIRLPRNGVIMAVGGGVTLDVAGF